MARKNEDMAFACHIIDSGMWVELCPAVPRN